jgi:hypothetical protein
MQATMLAVSYIIGLPPRLTVNAIPIALLYITLIISCLLKFHVHYPNFSATAQDLGANGVLARLLCSVRDYSCNIK